MTINDRYLNSEYLQANPQWHAEDAPWKALNVKDILTRNNINPISLCEVGCGSGQVLSELSKLYKEAKFHGFDISPDACQLWTKTSSERLELFYEDILISDHPQRYEVLMLLDVLEHVPNPWEFLQGLRNRADYFVFHFPLEFTAINALRRGVFSDARKKVGHIHYFNDELALCLLQECGFEVIDLFFTRAYTTAPNRTIRSKLAGLPRGILGSVSASFSSRLLGGDTLMVLAR